MKIVLPAFADMHVHLRQADMLINVCRYTKEYASHVLVMPNIKPAATTASIITHYHKLITKHIGSTKPIMSLMLTEDTTPKMIYEAFADADCRVVKFYPKNVTHNSSYGISRELMYTPSQRMWDCFEAMAKCGMSLSIHPEVPGEFSLNSENTCLTLFKDFLTNAPKELKIVLEHITTSEAVKFVRIYAKVRGNIAATITGHHMVLNHDDVMGRVLRPDNFCLPAPKYPHDQTALIEAAMSGEECFFLGSDSAPHYRRDKYGAECCAGVYTAPFLPQLLAHIFDHYEQVDKLPNFVMGFAKKFYHLQDTVENAVTLEKIPMNIAPMYDGVVPLWANRKLNWRMM